MTRKEDGFNLVVLCMIVAVLNILVAMALPSWSQYIRREREAELIFRGLQYAEAIRVFQIRNGRPPVTLKELVKVQPRAIRQLYKNPIAEDGSWLLLPAQQQQQQGQNLQNQNRRQGNPQQPRGANQGRPQPGNRPGQQQQQAAIRVIPGDDKIQPSMPFMGVASPEGEEAVKSFMGSQQVKEWQFTVDLVSAQMQSPHENFARPIHSGVFWKPFPEGITLPQTQQQQQQQQQQRQPQGNRDLVNQGLGPEGRFRGPPGQGGQGQNRPGPGDRNRTPDKN